MPRPERLEVRAPVGTTVRQRFKLVLRYFPGKTLDEVFDIVDAWEHAPSRTWLEETFKAGYVKPTVYQVLPKPRHHACNPLTGFEE